MSTLTAKSKSISEQNVRSLTMALESIGWDLKAVEIDLVSETARIDLRRDDLEVIFDARNGRSSITRGLIVPRAERVSRRGDSFRAEALAYEFLGRQNCPGMRSGLRTLANYIADNAKVMIPHERARDLLRPLLQIAA